MNNLHTHVSVWNQIIKLKKKQNMKQISVFMTNLNIHWKHKYSNMLVFLLMLHKLIL